MELNSLDLESKWVILLDKHIIDSGNNIKQLVEKAKKSHPHEKLTLAKVPNKESMIY